MSSSPETKFAARSPRPPSAFTEAERHAFAFAEEVRELAVGIVDAAIAEVVFEGKRDPKVYGLALLCRSISNFQGALTMARLDQAGGVPHAGPLLFRERVSGRPASANTGQDM